MNNNTFVVTFCGGMGAQIISSAIYFFLNATGQNVYADFSYFKRKAHFATEGNKGEITHWPWQIDHYGLHQHSFKQLEKFPNNVSIIPDGVIKNKLFFTSIKQQIVKDKFYSISKNFKNILNTTSINQENFSCIHIRRGDYVNVASHIVSDQDVINICKKISPIATKDLIVISDSPSINNKDIINQLNDYFENIYWFDNMDEIDAHNTMREAKILVTSNSQFSLTAACLSDNISFIPQTWFDPKIKETRELEKIIISNSTFSLLN